MKYIPVYVHVYKHSFPCFLWQCLVFSYTCPTTSRVILESCPSGEVVTWAIRSRHVREEVWFIFPPPRTTAPPLPFTRSHAWNPIFRLTKLRQMAERKASDASYALAWQRRIDAASLVEVHLSFSSSLMYTRFHNSILPLFPYMHFCKYIYIYLYMLVFRSIMCVCTYMYIFVF